MHIELLDLGSLDYQRSLAVQAERAAEVERGQASGFLILVEHPPILTVGRLADERDLIVEIDEWKRRGVEVIETNRGGKVTYHGPGQIVLYPILDLRKIVLDLHSYVRALEFVATDFLAGYGIDAARDPDPGHTGVWVGRDKIAAIGVHVRRWITTHGMAINVNNTTEIFREFVACGLRNRGATSVREILGREVDLRDARRRLGNAFADQFHADLASQSGSV